MKKYYREIALGLVLLLIFGGLLIWFIYNGTPDPLTIFVALLILLIGAVTFVWKIIQRNREIEEGIPAEDEFTKLAKVYAGNQTFLYSTYLWLFIFVFNAYFTNNRAMLGTGILGSALIYGVSLWYFRTRGEFDA